MINDGDEFIDELTILKELKILAGCFWESNKNWRQCGAYDMITKKFNKVWSRSKLETSSSPERNMTQYQPGGTAIFIIDKWLSQVCDSGWDDLGRWSYITIEGKKNQK
eukprot:14761019-Ditylum_brightwellii.AAC.1